MKESFPSVSYIKMLAQLPSIQTPAHAWYTPLMTDHTLDLRSPTPPSHPAEDVNQHTPQGALSWTTPEYEKPILRRNWWLVPMTVALAFVLLGIVTHNYFFIALVILACGMVLLNARRAPKILELEITGDAVRVGIRAIPSSELESFGIIQPPDLMHPLLSLTLVRGLSRTIRVPIIGIENERVRRAMRQLTKEEVHTETFTDILARKF